MDVFHSSNHHNYSGIVRQRIARVEQRYNSGILDDKGTRIAIRRTQIDMKN